MTKNGLTKIQRSVLEAAARRNDHAAWPIRGGKLNTGSATRVTKELIRKGLVDEIAARDKVPIWRENSDGQRLAAVITDEGLVAIGMLPAGKKVRSSGPSGNKGAVAAKQAGVPAVAQDEPRRPRAGTKLAILVALLEREEGATIEEMADATGWQGHSVRGVLSGTLTKKFGLQIMSEKVGGRGRTYRARGA